jgi:hypothetical protein
MEGICVAARIMFCLLTKRSIDLLFHFRTTFLLRSVHPQYVGGSADTAIAHLLKLPLPFRILHWPAD